MLFNSIEFAIFLPVVFSIYWLLQGKLKSQNFLLLVASYLFYGWWDYRFLSLIIFSSFVDFFVAKSLVKTEKIRLRKLYLTISILVNIGLLMFFKYFNFFADSLVNAFTLLGKPLDINRLKIILPVGISFYTFQTLSYTIDVYRKKLTPTNDALAFFTYVSFFPQLVAGPIERATNLLPQFLKERNFKYESAVDGLRQILGGLFKKMVIADNCAAIVNDIYGNFSDHSGGTLFLATILFAFQIYGDFSGYSDIAIGTSRLFGFSLMKNFNFPYFSRDIAEFWRRWHISLSSWFRDYLYIPLGGSRGSLLFKIRNTFIIFLVSGFWHGANWTFVVWGFINAVLFLPLLIRKKNRKNTNIVAENTILPSLRELINVLITFFFTCLAWVFFRAENVSSAISIIKTILTSIFKTSYKFDNVVFLYILILVIIEWINRKREFSFDFNYNSIPSFFRYSLYVIVVFLILWFGGSQQDFIYFQF